MKQKPRRTPWWRMDLIFAGMLLFIVLESRLKVPMWAHQVVLGIVVVLGFGTVMRWLWSNADSIQREDRLRQDAKALQRDLPLTERQASYRLAMIQRDVKTHRQIEKHDAPYDL